LCLASCGKPAVLPILGSVPAFELVAQSGQPFDSRALSGHVWVADFIYTTCPGPCPMMSSKMNRLQTSTDVKLVSFTVDPEDDTPAVLTEYGKHFKADSARWTFLTGDRSVLNNLGLHAFHLNSVDGSLIHSTRFTLVDRQARIRGYYSSEEDGFLPKLLHDLRQLEAEKS
jgi:protein SCO1/2